MISCKYVITEQEPFVEEYLALRNAVQWRNPTSGTAAAGLNGSLLCVCVRHNDKLVGFGRVIGDGCFTFYIQDIIIHPDHQGKGLGKAVMNRIMDYIEAVNGEDACVGLMATKGSIEFYEQFGFSVRTEDAPGMQRLPKFRRR